MKVINLFGSPGAGKSSGAAYLFYLLKQEGLNVELVTEFAKDKFYEQDKEVFKNQLYVFGKQDFRLSRLRDSVDIAITDSPILLSIYYDKNNLGHSFHQFVYDRFNHYDNYNYYIDRVKPYNPMGRFQTKEESNQISIELKEMLKDYKIPYKEVLGNEFGYMEIFNSVMSYLKK